MLSRLRRGRIGLAEIGLRPRNPNKARLREASSISLLAMACLVAPLSCHRLSAAQLPGGTGSFFEPHGQWTVACRGQNGVVGCVLSQVQTDPQSGKPMLSAELRPLHLGEVEGALLLPFGLALAKGVQITGTGLSQPLTFAFSTCLPGGCIVPLRLSREVVTALTDAAETPAAILTVKAETLSFREPVSMRIPLAGLSAALARAAELSH